MSMSNAFSNFQDSIIDSELPSFGWRLPPFLMSRLQSVWRKNTAGHRQKNTRHIYIHQSYIIYVHDTYWDIIYSIWNYLDNIGIQPMAKHSPSSSKKTSVTDEILPSHCKGRDEMQGLQRVKGEAQLCSYDIFNLQGRWYSQWSGVKTYILLVEFIGLLLEKNKTWNPYLGCP